MRISRLRYLLISIICGLSFSLSAQANVILQAKSLTNAGTVGPNLASTVFDPFDTSLGTLDSVNMTFNGLLQISGTFAPNPSGPNGSAVPYAYNINVAQSLYGLIGFNNFGFSSPAQFNYNGVSAGIGEPFFFITPISYSLSFNETTDLLGFTLPSGLVAQIPPAYVSGLREDFHEDAINSLTGLQMQNLLITTTTSGWLPVIPNVLMSNTIFLTYNYTPLEVAVPEPGALLLLSSGLFILAYMPRRRVKPRFL